MNKLTTLREGHRPNITLNFAISSNGKSSSSVASSHNSTRDDNNDTTPNYSSTPALTTSSSSSVKRKRENKKSDILLWLESYEERKNKRNDEMMARKEEMHNKTLTLMYFLHVLSPLSNQSCVEHRLSWLIYKLLQRFEDEFVLRAFWNHSLKVKMLSQLHFLLMHALCCSLMHDSPTHSPNLYRMSLVGRLHLG